MTTPSTAFWTLADWQSAYARGRDAAEMLLPLAESLETDDVAWITRVSAEHLRARLQQLSEQALAAGGSLRLPLHGVPFAVKDNVDVAGLPTTCACPEFAYTPARSAAAIDRLEAAGAVVVGKTNLDQFATGLTGTRSPFGPVPNAFRREYISGGSSSGSASVVARGLVPFALGTDTAGSGRVPAGHNNLVGLKPTRGLVSTRGVVPACRSLDCVSVLALNVEDADQVLRAMSGFDEEDPYSRRARTASPPWPLHPVLGIPQPANWCGDADAERTHARALKRLAQLGVQLRPVDFAPLFEAAALLYDGPWVAERYAAFGELIGTRPEAVHPVVRGIVEKATSFNAVDTFKAEYRRMTLARRAESLLEGLDGLLVPTAPTIPTIEQVLADPVALNACMGTYTNFVNLLDWSAIALPAGLRSDGLPAGLTLIAPAWHEPRLIEFGRRWQSAAPWKRGVSQKDLPAPPPPPAFQAGEWVVVAVVGAHLSGMPLNGQLIERGAMQLETTRTSAAYRLYALAGSAPPKPGLARTGKGAPIEVELWSMPVERFGSLVALIPPPLGIGTVELADGRRVHGFLCETWAIAGARDITAFGGWRPYLERLESNRI